MSKVSGPSGRPRLTFSVTRTPAPAPVPHPGVRGALDAAQRARAVFRGWAARRDTSVIAAELTGPSGQIWELSVLPLASSTSGLHVIGNVYEEWSYDVLALHGAALIAALRELENIGRSGPDLARAVAGRRVLGYGGSRILGGLRRTFALPTLDTIECVQRAYAPIAGYWDAVAGDWTSVSLEEACERENVNHDAHTRTERCVQLTAALIRAVAAHPEDA